jgi:hypothetical protein
LALRHCPRRHGVTLPYFHCGLPAQPNVGWPEVAQWKSSFVIFFWNCLNQLKVRFKPFKICLNFKYFWNLIKSTLIDEFKYILQNKENKLLPLLIINN